MVSCRKEETIVPSTNTEVTDPFDGDVTGMYLLNEGNMGSNKCTLDYLDITTGTYSKNIFAERNPEVGLELGDVGNDIQIWEDRLYAVINCSNLVEVMSIEDATHIDAISIPNCRYIAFWGNYAYVSSYAGEVGLDPNARTGYIAKIDLETLDIIDWCDVGYQPEEMAIYKGKLYIANSGGYRVPDYDNRVMVVDLNTFTVTKEIEVAVNLHHAKVDSNGYIWVSSRGDYYDISSKIFVIDSSSDEVVKEFDIPCSNMAVCGDYIYILSTEFSYSSMDNEISFAKIYTPTMEVVADNIITDGTESSITVPYGLAINPETEDIYITDAKDYVTPGKLHCYSPEGVLQWSVTTGDIPAHMAFVIEE